MEQNTTITGIISKLVLVFYILNVVWICVLIFWTITIISTFKASVIGVVISEIIFTLLMIYILYGFLCFFFRLPFKTTLQGPRLTTYSILGTRTINLQELVSITPALLIIGRPQGTYLLKLITRSTSLYLHLGSIPTKQRKPLFTAIEPYLFNPNLKKESGSEQIFKNWIART